MKNMLRAVWMKSRKIKTNLKKYIWGQYWLETVPAIKAAEGAYGGPSLTHIALYTEVNAGDVLLPRCLRDVFEVIQGSFLWDGINAHRLVTDDVIEKINHSSGVLIGGGGLFLKDTNPNKLSGWQWSCSLDALRKIKVPIALFAVGYNRFRGQEDFSPVFSEHLSLLAEKSVYIGLRNQGSIRAIKKYLPVSLHEKIRFQPCMTTVCKILYPEIINKAREEGDETLIAVNCAFDRIDKRLEGRQDEILHRLAVSIRELSLSSSIAYYAHSKSDERMLPYLDRVGVPYTLVKLYDVHPREVLVAYSKAGLAIGMRGHAQMIPFGCGTPIISLISHDKMRWFLEDIGCPEWGVEMLSEGFERSLCQKAVSVMEFRNEIVARIDTLQESLLEVTRRNVADFCEALTSIR